jgi:hypothetical protein
VAGALRIEHYRDLGPIGAAAIRQARDRLRPAGPGGDANTTPIFPRTADSPDHAESRGAKLPSR